MDKMMIRGAVLVTALMSAGTLGFVSPEPQTADRTVDASIVIEDHNDAVTELGKKHHAWARERGLPSALDHHDHP